MTKITEEQRAELLASNASRDVVEAVLARLDAAEKNVADMHAMLKEHMPQDDSGCYFCAAGHFYDDKHKLTARHMPDCEYAALLARTAP